MTDFSAGLPLFDLTPMVEMRAYAMAHIAMLDAVKSATHPNNAGYTSVDAAVAAAAHDVLVAEFGIFFGPKHALRERVHGGAGGHLSRQRQEIAASTWARPPPPRCSRSRANEDVLGGA